ncbi:site-specific DNA-methyltransferase [Nitrosomonas ureae]|uniref:Adenine-specific DNA-methyltransferase n=1 Tax=Nitrosomonas ureae TaxID=44577 RepID=A0A2T5IXB9_9PROT|nr:site-specific DNA-methyltransferase [Nitrosomonas ureae]PTQ88612.1 adenine-specific DNA-methyltransferase [Nitrosomonas ureae]
MAENEDRAGNGSSPKPQQETLRDDEFSLELQQVSQGATIAKKTSSGKVAPDRMNAKNQAAEVLSYRHGDKRTNNPHVGMVDTHSDGVEGRAVWQYDPHIDPALQFDSHRSSIENLIDEALASGDKDRMQKALEQLKRMQSPYLNWAGRAERTSFDVDTVSLHVHERIDPATILAAAQRSLKDTEGEASNAIQPDLFHAPFENLPLRDAIDFYKHERDWSNRLIAGDSLLVMNSLLQKEGMAGQVQMIYIDPPYGIKYGSNFQPFVNKRDVKDRKDEDLTQEPEMIKAFRDTWELGIHSYLTYLRDRLLLAKELLHESGSVFVQISDENVHHVREICDEVLGMENFVAVICYKKPGQRSSTTLNVLTDFVVWYAKNLSQIKYSQLYNEKSLAGDGGSHYSQVEVFNGSIRPVTAEERFNPNLLPKGARIFQTTSLTSAGAQSGEGLFVFRDQSLFPPPHKHWSCSTEGLYRAAKANRIDRTPTTIRYKRYFYDLPVMEIDNRWDDVGLFGESIYVVQTGLLTIERCLLMTTDSGDLAFDPTCGSGTTAFVAEKWGRRWITCDTSRVAVTLAKQRLMTASYDYFELKYPHEGLKSGFIYKTVPHVTLKSIANNPEIDEIYARMHSAVENALVALNRVVNQELQEWHVPFNFPIDWPETAKKPFDGFHAARQAMQKQMDASIAAHADTEILYDQPAVSKSKLRITGPFTVEAVPFATVLGLDEVERPKQADVAVARSGATWRQSQWRDELLKSGIRGKGGRKFNCSIWRRCPERNIFTPPAPWLRAAIRWR